MAPTYNLRTDFPSDDLIDQSPYWVVGIARFDNQVTFDPKTKDEINSVSTNDADAMKSRNMLILSQQIVQLTVAAAKDSHVTNLQAVLVPYIDYLPLIMPGDWVVACIVNNEQEGKQLEDDMLNWRPINQFNRGLKFIGKVSSFRKSIHVQADGTRSTSFSMQAVGFGEFDSLLYYHPQLQKGMVELANLKDFGLEIEKITNGSSSTNGSGIDINKVLPALIGCIFGDGAWAKAQPTKLPSVTVTATANTRYLIHEDVAKWLGVTPTNVSPTWADMLSVKVGLQHYQNQAGGDEQSTKGTPEVLFEPELTDMIGQFKLAAPAPNQTVWNTLSTYCNPPINEMYVAIRSEPKTGRLLPSFVVRQTPYSSDMVQSLLDINQDEGQKAAQQDAKTMEQFGGTGNSSMYGPTQNQINFGRSATNADATRFLELPRWKLSVDMVYGLDIGRSDAARFNMVYISAQGLWARDDYNSFVRAPPIIDTLDVKRHGIRPYIRSINCLLAEAQKGPTVWRDLMCDLVMGQQLWLNGTIECIGLQAPVAPGDNLEFDDIVFHIEQVTHQAVCNPDGRRSFRTTLQLSHGVSVPPQSSTNRADIFAALDPTKVVIPDVTGD
jgi:hypothetical protein